jgi:hypothetical protein
MNKNDKKREEMREQLQLAAPSARELFYSVM